MISVEDHHLIMLMEECAEAAQRASKQLRFGRDEVQPGQAMPNHWRLRDEILDVLAVVERLQEANLIEPITQDDVIFHRREKQAKVDRMMALSRAQGRLAVETSPALVCGGNHVWEDLTTYGAAVCKCGARAGYGKWYCPDSADHLCVYSENLDSCDFCGQPEERK